MRRLKQPFLALHIRAVLAHSKNLSYISPIVKKCVVHNFFCRNLPGERGFKYELPYNDILENVKRFFERIEWLWQWDR